MNSSFIAVKGQDALFLFDSGVTYIATSSRPVYVEHGSNIYKTVVNTGPGVIPPSSPWILLGSVPASGVTSITAGGGLSGGTITTTGTIGLNGIISPSSYTLTNITVDKYGRITAASSGTALTSITAGAGLSGGTITSTGTISLPNSGVVAGTYTLSTITVDQYGRVTDASSGLSGGAVNSIATTAGITGGTITTNGTIGLGDSGVAADTYTNPIITIDSKGRITNASSGVIGSGTVTQIATENGISGGTITSIGSVGLTSSGVVAGTYTFPTINVDKFGRITLASTNTGGTATLPGGANGQVQYNEIGSFSGTTAFTYNKLTKAVSLVDLYLINIPQSGNTGDQILTRNTTNGRVRFVSSTNLIVSPGGANEQIQYNENGVFSGTSSFIYKKTLRAITLGSRNVTGSTGQYSVSFGNNNVGSGQYSFVLGNGNIASAASSVAIQNNNRATGSISYAEGELNLASGTLSHVEGGLNVASGNYSHSQGNYTIASGEASHSSGKGSGVTKEVIASGIASFNHSMNNSSQTAGHGALAANSAIIGGINHNIASGNDRAVVIGGNSIKVTSGYSDHAVVANLAIFTNPNAGGTDDLLTWNATTKKIGKVTQGSISDIRLKTNIDKIEQVVDSIDQLSIFEYVNNGIVKELEQNKNYGLIAQEVEKIFPHVVKNNFNYDGNTYKTVDYKHLVPILFAAIKELNSKIKVLENK